MFFMRKIPLILGCALSLFWGVACQKVSPEILALSKGETPVFNQTPLSGRVTLGSGEFTSASYKLKARIGLVQPADSSSASYNLKGTIGD